MIRDRKLKEWYKNNRDKKSYDITKILDVEYAHLKLQNSDDIFITSLGLPFINNLKPENYWKDERWFKSNSTRLSGTSSIYKIRTKKVKGKYKDIVIKWNRMGQEVPGLEEDETLMHAEFNSPFEEFSLVIELRNAMLNLSNDITIQKPLAIYVPSRPVELWQSGRKEYKMRLKVEAHKEIALDMFRSYAVIYEWIEGIDASEAFNKDILKVEHMKRLTLDAGKKMQKKGFIVRDNKPHHIIINPEEAFKKIKKKKIPYGLVDFELLERTPKHEKMLKKDKRSEYLKRQRDRFSIEIPDKFHPHLHHMNIFGVDYIYGHVESTKGRLWVAGRDPFLFDYFLPERWKQIPKTKISVFSEMYHAVTKDNIHLVWKVSQVGSQPNMDPFKEDENKILAFGYNSPFEEVSLAVELAKKGVPAIYPRAIYMSEQKTEISKNLRDNSRHKTHRNYKTPDNAPILMKNHDYIIIWGYWNGPDEKLAAKDGDYYEGIDVFKAYKQNIITQKEYVGLLKMAKERLEKIGVEDLNLRGNHFLISFDSKGRLLTDSQNVPEIRICNFEFLRKK